MFALHDALPGHYALPLVEVGTRRGIRHQHRLLCLFQLQQQRGAVAVGEQPKCAERADAADADYLEGHIGQPVAVEQNGAVLRLTHFVRLERSACDDVERFVVHRGCRRDAR